MQKKEVGMLKEQVNKQLKLVHELQSTLEGPDYKEVFNQWLREKNVLQLQVFTLFIFQNLLNQINLIRNYLH